MHQMLIADNLQIEIPDVKLNKVVGVIQKRGRKHKERDDGFDADNSA